MHVAALSEFVKTSTQCDRIKHISMSSVSCSFAKLLKQKGFPGSDEQLKITVEWLATNDIWSAGDMRGLGHMHAVTGETCEQT